MTGDVLSDYCAWSRRQGRSANTTNTRRKLLARLAVVLGPLDALDPEQVADYVAGQRRPESRRAVACAVRDLWRWASGHGVPMVDPTTELPRIRVPRHLPHPSGDDVVDRAYTLAVDPWDRAALVLEAFGGLRGCEVCTVTPADLVRVHGGSRVRVVGKGGVERLAPMPSWAADEVRPWLPIGRSPITVQHRVTRLLRAAGQPSGGPHSLRHHYATSLLRACHDLRIVQEALGHASPETTAIYTLIDEDAATRAAETLARPRRLHVA